jgi:RNA polymerase sigma-70 factor (ECF subfamily)
MNLSELLKQCRRDGKKCIAAQNSIYDQYADKMFLLCNRYLKSAEMAKEMMMNGFLKFFASVNSFSHLNDAATEAWMRKIMVNECLMYLRLKNKHLIVTTAVLPEIAIQENISSNLNAKEIYKLISELPPGYRTVFNMYVLEKMDHFEIAKALGISQRTSRSQLVKARRKLQQILINSNKDYEARTHG